MQSSRNDSDYEGSEGFGEFKAPAEAFASFGQAKTAVKILLTTFKTLQQEYDKFTDEAKKAEFLKKCISELGVETPQKAIQGANAAIKLFEQHKDALEKMGLTDEWLASFKAELKELEDLFAHLWQESICGPIKLLASLVSTSKSEEKSTPAAATALSWFATGFLSSLETRVNEDALNNDRVFMEFKKLEFNRKLYFSVLQTIQQECAKIQDDKIKAGFISESLKLINKEDIEKTVSEGYVFVSVMRFDFIRKEALHIENPFLLTRGFEELSDLYSNVTQELLRASVRVIASQQKGVEKGATVPLTLFSKVDAESEKKKSEAVAEKKR